jgi:glycerophosphoryl diester phosphodiesterase
MSMRRSIMRLRSARAVTLLPLLVLALAACVSSPTPQATPQPNHQPTNQPTPLIIAHRGASGHRPEHTRAAYELAIAQGADYIEPDLVPTKDGVLVVRHENDLSDTTDVATRFPERRTQKTIDGESRLGFFSEDFTLAELRTLRAKERLPSRSHAFDGQLPILTLTEVLDLVASKERELGRRIGIYPELKHPAYFSALGFHVEEALLQALTAAGYTHRGDPVFIQSFEPLCLQRLRARTALRLIQLIDEADKHPPDLLATGDRRSYGDLLQPAGLHYIKSYADGIGVHKALILPPPKTGEPASPSALIRDAHAHGLLVHVYTLRAEPVFVLPAFRANAAAEVLAFLDLGVDGLFCDSPDLCLQVRGGAGARR